MCYPGNSRGPAGFVQPRDLFWFSVETEPLRSLDLITTLAPLAGSGRYYIVAAEYGAGAAETQCPTGQQAGNGSCLGTEGDLRLLLALPFRAKGEIYPPARDHRALRKTVTTRTLDAVACMSLTLRGGRVSTSSPPKRFLPRADHDSRQLPPTSGSAEYR